MPHRSEIILEGEQLSKSFGGTIALWDVEFSVRRGEILGVIGPNGAGKTTLLNAVSGIISPSGGVVRLQGRNITGLAPHAIARLGVTRVLQTPRLFPGMTVLENIMVGALFGTRVSSNPVATAREAAESTLRFMELEHKKAQPVTTLGLQEKKLVELARALAPRPVVVLVDEVMSGLNPGEVEGCMNLLRRIRDELQVAIIWVEHVMKAIMGTADRVTALVSGRVVITGSPAEVAANPAVLEAYLGVPNPG
jgi:branched-chain amino acid transport system ATP-binding protein